MRHTGSPFELSPGSDTDMTGTPPEYADDADLIAAIGRGDETAMAEVVRSHRSAVFAFARRLINDDARADEIAQDVFLRLWERWDRYDRDRAPLRSFLMALTHSRSLDVARSDSARRRRERRDAEQPAEVGHGPEAQIMTTELEGLVRAALDRLTEAERRAVELAYFDGHSYRRVAELLGEPEGTVKARIRRTLAKLRADLADQELRD